MKFNIYFFIVGVLSVLFSVTHAYNGQAAVLPLIDASTLETATKTTVFYVWHIITVENLIFGLVFLAMSFYKDGVKASFVAWLIVLIICSRWLIIFAGTLIKDFNGFSAILVDSAAIFLYVALILSGIRKNTRLRA